MAMLTRIMLGIPGAKAVHHYVPHFEVVAQVVIMLFELRKAPVAAMIIHEPLVVAKVSSYIHSGNCPSSWATSQHPTFGSTQRYEPATLLAITQCHCCHHLASVRVLKKSQRLMWPSCQLNKIPTPPSQSKTY